MKPEGHFVLRFAAQAVTPLLALFAAVLAASYAPGQGVGLSIGLGFALLLTLHILTYGAAAARVALPPALARGLLAGGVLIALAGAGLPGLPFAAAVREGGLALTAASGTALVLTVLIGRAPTLRDKDW